MNKRPRLTAVRLHHLWLATAIVGTGALSLTTYSERVLVPEGYAPAGLTAPADPVGAPAPQRLTSARPTQPAAARQDDRPGAHRLINRAGGDPIPGPLAPGGDEPLTPQLDDLPAPTGKVGHHRTAGLTAAELGQSLIHAGPNGVFEPSDPQHSTALQPTVVESPGPDDVAAAVPEPSTWLMFLLGLGVLGYALRAGRGSFANDQARGGAGATDPA